MSFVKRSHQLFYLAAATAIIASAVVIASAHLPQKETETSKAAPEQNVEAQPSFDYQMDNGGY